MMPPGRKMTMAMKTRPSVRLQPSPTKSESSLTMGSQRFGQEAEGAVQRIFVEAREDVLEILDDGSTDDRADQRADTAEDGHEHDFARSRPLHALRTASGSTAAISEPARPA